MKTVPICASCMALLLSCLPGCGKQPLDANKGHNDGSETFVFVLHKEEKALAAARARERAHKDQQDSPKQSK